MLLRPTDSQSAQTSIHPPPTTRHRKYQGNKIEILLSNPEKYSIFLEISTQPRFHYNYKPANSSWQMITVILRKVFSYIRHEKWLFDGDKASRSLFYLTRRRLRMLSRNGLDRSNKTFLQHFVISIYQNFIEPTNHTYRLCMVQKLST